MPNRRRAFSSLRDVPASVDAFGAHRETAEALLRLFRREDGGRTVALLGPLGSGKSTVVEMLRSLSQDDDASDPQVFVFVYDAWAQEADALRRSLLLKLITDLRSVEWIDGRAWAERAKAIASKRRTVLTSASPELSNLGAAVALAVLAAPLGVAVFSGVPYPTNLWGVVIALLPIILVFGGSPGRAADRDPENTPGEEPSGPPAQGLAALWSSVRSSREVVTEEELEQSSTAFHRVFAEVARAATSPSRRVVVVIDNLDRLHAEGVLAAWRDLRALWSVEAVDDGDWRDRTWVLVPFDLNSLESATPAAGARRPVDALDKAIDLQFDVPPPLSYKLSEYLEESLSLAFAETPKAEISEVARVALLLRGAMLIESDEAKPQSTDEDDSEPSTQFELIGATPRQVVAFVNEIGTYSEASAPDTALSTIAAYIVLRRAKWSPGNPLPLRPATRNEFGSEFEFDLLALHYRRPREEVASIAGLEEAFTALKGGNRDAIDAIATRPWGRYAIDAATDQLSCAERPTTGALAMAAFCLASRRVAANSRGMSVLARLSARLQRVDRLTPLSIQEARGVAWLIARTRDEQLARSMLQKLSTDPASDARPWAVAARAVLRVALPVLGRERCQIEFSAGSEFEQYCKQIHAVRAVFPERCWFLARPGIDPADLMARFGGSSDYMNSPAKLDRLMPVMTAVGAEWDWSPVAIPCARGIAERAKVVPDDRIGGMDEAQLRGATCVLLRIASFPNGRSDELIDLARDGALVRHLDHATMSSPAAGVLLAAILIHGRPDATPFDDPVSERGRLLTTTFCSSPADQPEVLHRLGAELLELGLDAAALASGSLLANAIRGPLAATIEEQRAD